MALDLILQPFANNGDKMTPPQTSPTGFVNFNDGYTADYEISLASGNPQAKAVERQIQNYMFGQSSEHQMAWEGAALPPWFSTMPGGYRKNAYVVRQSPGGDWKPYRSLANNNIDDPLVSTSTWEYQPTAKEIIAVTPMPAGAGDPANEVILVATDFNALTGPGTWEFKSDAIAAASSNTPSPIAGMLEAKQWTNATPVALTVQRYSDAGGAVFVRAYNGAAWLPWARLADFLSVRNGAPNRCAATMPTTNNYVLSAIPAISTRVSGLVLHFKVPASNTGPSTIDDGNGAKPLLTQALSAMTGSELLLNGEAEIRWNNDIVAGGCWVVVSCDGSVAAQATTTAFGVVKLATTLEARGFTEPSHVLTPNTLSEALKGANQLLAPIGFQLFPGGLIHQWGEVAFPDIGSILAVPVAFNSPFPNSVYQIMMSIGLTGGFNVFGMISEGSITTAGFTAILNETSAVAQTGGKVHWFAIGR